MTTANILCFLCGSLVSAIAAFIYATHIERVHFYQLQAARRAGLYEGQRTRKMQPLQPTFELP